MNEIVRDAVDVPRNAYRIDKTENEHHPQRQAREKIKHPEKVNTVHQGGGNRQRVPARVRKDLGISRRPLYRSQFARRHWHGA